MSNTDRPSQHSINEMQDKADAEAKQGNDVSQAKVEPDEADSEAIVSELLPSFIQIVLTLM